MNEEIKENLEIFKEKADSIINDYTDLDDKMRNRKIQIEDQRRSFYQSIAVLALAILGSSYFLKLSVSGRYFFSGASLLIVMIFFILLHLREIIDLEANQLETLRKRWRRNFNERFPLVLKYLQGGDYSKEKVKEFFDKEVSLPTFDEIKKAGEQEELELKDKPLDYSGELIIFLFLSGVFLIIGSIIPSYFNWMVILLGEIVLLFISCANTARYISDIFSKFADCLVNKMFK